MSDEIEVPALAIERGDGRPVGYYVDGRRVPSVTSILKWWGDATGLIKWATRIAREGGSPDDERDAKGLAGTIAHDAIEATIHGEELGPVFADAERAHGEEIAVWASNTYQAWLAWREEEGRRLDFVATELELVSRRYRFGGTVDAIAWDRTGAGRVADGDLVLIDWKTSRSLSTTYVYQAAAYAIAWEERRGRWPRIGAAAIVRLDRETGRWASYWTPDPMWRAARDQFRRIHAAYQIDQQIRATMPEGSH